MQDKIVIKGAREHNLKNIDLVLPKYRLIVFTGVSGSGKSSLAFDTIYAEGQRRYVESLSSYARQFLGIMDKPDVDSIEGLSPSISIDQKSASHNPRSTVGTVTEIYDYFRLLYARLGHPHCPTCRREIVRQSSDQIVSHIFDFLTDKLLAYGKKQVRFIILSPVIRGRKGEFRELFTNLKSKGFTRIRIDNKMFDIDDDLVLIKTNKHDIDVVIDRFSVEKSQIRDSQKRKILQTRLTEAVEMSLTLSDGLVKLCEISDASFVFPEDPKISSDHLYSQKFSCPDCNISMPEIEPRMFSFNSPHGACPVCSGLGVILRIDPTLIIRPNLTISEGGILPFPRVILSDTWYGRIFIKACENIGIPKDIPLKNLNEEKMQKLLYGTREIIYEVQGENRHGKNVTIHEIYRGIIPELERRFQETESEYVRNEIHKYMREETCSSCGGKRLKNEALSVTLDNLSISDITEFSINNLIVWIVKIQKDLSSRERQIGSLIFREITARLSFLSSVGLDYLTLGRNANSLAGGEAQRIRLASQIGSGLSGVLYVLDEPSIGLHPRDNYRLIDTLKKLRDLGNTVIVVEHDREMMNQSDLLVDFGPQAGEHGGQIMSIGTSEEIKKNRKSLTGLYLSGRKNIQIPGHSGNDQIKYLKISGCRANNLKNIVVTFPLNKFICVTGVSGSGKSTLIVDTLYHAVASHLNSYHREKAGLYEHMDGMENIRRIILIDQSPIGRTPRSNPATYTGVFTHIRDLFSQTPQSRIKGFSQGRFSFNIRGGRCEACEGEGMTKIEMQFLPDVYITCDVCRGTRYNNETLGVQYKGKNIADILRMTVEESFKFFENIPAIYNKLETLNSVGLSYIHLGQPAPQLSGGEAQRVKLATELSKKGSLGTLYILDEPTTGLHFADLEKLIYILRQLVNMGNTVVVIEHNIDVIANSDWIIDLGPEGGDKGGEIVGYGTPSDLKKNMSSLTGRFIR